jgi:hypothetical protein
VTFNKAEQDGTANPAYVDSLVVDIIPDPATLGLFIVAGTGVMMFRRASR